VCLPPHPFCFLRVSLCASLSLSLSLGSLPPCVCPSLLSSSCLYTHCPDCASLPAENAKKLAGTGVFQRYSVERDRSRISVHVPFPLPAHLEYTLVLITHAYSTPQRSLYIVSSCKYILPIQTYHSHCAGNYQPIQA